MAVSTLLIRRSAVTVAEIFRLLLTEHYTGSVTFHFAGGQPRTLEYGRPHSLTIYSQVEESVDNATVVSSR